MAVEPRKAPRQPRARATFEAILEAAAYILEQRGIEGYNTNAIAEQAGVSIGSIYQYFPDKDAITAGLIRRETAALLADVELARQAPGAREGLIHMINAAVRHQLGRPLLARLIDIEEARLPLAEDDAGIERALVALVVEILEHPGLGRVPDCELAAHDVVAITKGMTDAAGLHGETDAVSLASRVRGAVFGYLDRMHEVVPPAGTGPLFDHGGPPH